MSKQVETDKDLENLKSKIATINKSHEWQSLTVKLVMHDGGLYLRGIFPPKKADEKPKQIRYKLGYKATLLMLPHAEEKGRKIGLKLALGEFKWDIEQPMLAIAALATASIPVTIAEWVDRRELSHWQVHVKTNDSIDHWRNDYGRIFDKLILDHGDSPLNIDRLIDAACKYSDPDSRTRVRWVNACGTLASLAKLDKSLLLKIRGNYSPYRQVNPRDIPTAAEVVEAFSHLLAQDPTVARWFGMLAIGGFRPSELEKLNLDRFGERNHPVLVMKTKNKLDRETYCYPRKWYDLFELDRFTPPEFGGKTARIRASRITRRFKELGLTKQFYPYNMRHRKAIELLLEAKLPADVAIKMLGHRPEIFNRVYLNWINKDHYDRLFDDLAERDN